MLRERSPGQAAMGFRNLEVRLSCRRGPDPAKWINRIRRHFDRFMARVASGPAFSRDMDSSLQSRSRETSVDFAWTGTN